LNDKENYIRNGTQELSLCLKNSQPSNLLKRLHEHIIIDNDLDELKNIVINTLVECG